MKRIRCPKCTEQIQFDETQYAPGSILVFTCPGCNKQFRLRLSRHQATDVADTAATLIALENDFQQKQTVTLQPGENIIGKKLRGATGSTTFLTVDPSIDPCHCRIMVQTASDGSRRYLLSDGPSNTGTFLNGNLLAPRDAMPLDDGAVINIGAATLIFQSHNH